MFSRNSWRSASWSGIASLATPIAQIAATPYLLLQLGPEIYGVWILLSSILTIVGMADMGLSPATTLFVSKHRASNAHADITRIAKAAFLLYLVLGVIGVLMLLLGTSHLLHFLGVSKEQVQSLAQGLPFFALSVGFQFLYMVPCSLIRGFERYDLDGMLHLFTTLITLFIVCATVYFGGGIPVMLAAQASVLALAFCTALLLAAKLIGNSKWLIPYCSFCSLKEFLAVSIYGWIQAFSGSLFSQADRLIISAFLGPAALAFYNSALQLAQAAHGFMARSLAFLFPRFTALETDRGAKLRLFNRGMFLTTVLGSLAAIILFWASPALLHLWLGQEIPSDLPDTLRVLALVNGFTATSIVPSALMFGAGQFRLAAIFSLLSGLIVSSAALLMIPAYGLMGAAVAKLTFLPASIASRVFMYHYSFGVWSWTTGIRQLLPVASALTPPVAAVWFISNATFTCLSSLSVGVAATTCGLALMFSQCRRQYGPLW